MKRTRTMITDLPFDVLKLIMVCVAVSADGAANLARMISVCKLFMKLAEDSEVLKAVVFNNLDVLDRLELFQEYNGLLTRSALAGNAAAEYVLAKVILVSSSVLWYKERKLELLKELLPDQMGWISIAKYISKASSFMAHFQTSYASSSRVPQGNTCHYQLVRRFLCRCSPDDLSEMRPHMRDYFRYFIRFVDHDIFIDTIDNMCNSHDTLKDLKSLKNMIDRHSNQRKFVVWSQKEIEENNKESQIFMKKLYRTLAMSLAIEVKCRHRCMDHRLILRGDLKEFDQAHSKVVAEFEMYRAHAISVFNDLYLQS